MDIHRARWLVISVLAVTFATPALAQRLAYSGLDPSAHIGDPGALPYTVNLVRATSGLEDPAIAYVSPDSDVSGLLTAAGFSNLTEVTTADLDTTDLSGFDLLWVGRVTGGSAVTDVALAEANVQSYFDAGGNIVAEDQRVEPNSYDWLPFGDNLGPVTSDQDVVTIVVPDHPTVLGLDDADLSGWGNSHHKLFTTPETDGFLTVATGFEGEAVLIVRGDFTLASPVPVPATGPVATLLLILLSGLIGLFMMQRARHA